MKCSKRWVAPSLGLAMAMVTFGHASIVQPVGKPEHQPQPTVPAGGEEALTGPKVRDRSAESLVRTDMQGRLEQLDIRPEEAALNLMKLDPPRRENARAVVEERGASIRRHLVANIDLVKTSTDAIRSGDQATAQRLARELYDRFDPKHERDPLAGPLSAMFTAEEAAEFKRLVDEYWKAWIDAELKAAPGPTREEMQSRLSFRQFQAEVQTAYQYKVRPFQQKLDAIYTAADPTTEQRAAIRAAVIDYIREGQLKPSEAQREKLARTIYESLDEARRIKLVSSALSAI